MMGRSACPVLAVLLFSLGCAQPATRVPSEGGVPSRGTRLTEEIPTGDLSNYLGVRLEKIVAAKGTKVPEEQLDLMNDLLSAAIAAERLEADRNPRILVEGTVTEYLEGPGQSRVEVQILIRDAHNLFLEGKIRVRSWSDGDDGMRQASRAAVERVRDFVSGRLGRRK